MEKILNTISQEEINKIKNSEFHDPHSILGQHLIEVGGENFIVIRAYNPYVKDIFVIDDKKKKYKMNKIDPEGFFERIFNRKSFFKYRLYLEYSNGTTKEIYDPYSFLPTVSDFDLYLFNKGDNLFAYKFLGAHIKEVNGVKGVSFVVWAPGVKRVSVVGDFNNWDGRVHQMRVLGSSGVWEIFIPGVEEGSLYKYEIKTQDGRLLLKSDPYGFYMEKRPKTASIVYNIDKYKWHDDEWMAKRREIDYLKEPISIYEVHLGSWLKNYEKDPESGYLNYRELAHLLVEYIKEMGYTHIELLPVAEHPFDGSWGYQVIGYFAPTSRFGTPEDFKYFVDYMHQNGIGVIVDWVPGHFPKDEHGLANFIGEPLYEYADPRKGEHLDWGTKVFDYGRNEVRNFLLTNAVFWAQEYHIDGLRVDAVASMLYLDYSRPPGGWVPNIYGGNENLEAISFLRKLNEELHNLFPSIMVIAEESTAWPGVSRPTYVGGLGFTFKWNMGWMNDFLRYISKDPIFRKYHHNDLTFSMMYAYSENFILVVSHDEVVHGKANFISKMPGNDWEKFANVRVALGFMFGHPGKKLLFQGIDIGQWREWDYNSSVDWYLLEYESHHKLNRYVRDLLNVYKYHSPLWEEDYNPHGFQWINCNDAENSVVSFIRRDSKGEFLVFVCNFTPVMRYNYRIGVPAKGIYKELLNSDWDIYWGSNIRNPDLYAEDIPWNNQPYSINMIIPPLACVILKRE